jgi:type VI secretion system protein
VACDRTLLERLADPDPQGQRTVREDPRRVVDSVMRNLQKLLNTRQGEALIQPDYGMPDITDCAEGAPETLDRVCRAIKSTIEKFEPRLHRVRVTHFPAGNDLNLHFGITGQVVTERDQIPVYFNTTVNPSGNAVIAVGQELDQKGSPDRVHSEVRAPLSRWTRAS